MAAVAVADVLRSEEAGEGTPRDRGRDVSAEDRLDRAASAFRDVGLQGTLVYTDRSCRLRALRVPGLQPVAPPAGPEVGCGFELSPNGERVAPAGAAWGTSAYYAVCRGNTVEVRFPPGARPLYAYTGCVPAWRQTPDGPYVLTLVRDGEVLEVRPSCERQPPCEEVVLDRSDIVAAAEADSGASAFSAVDVADIEWVSPQRVRVLLALTLRFGVRRIVATYDSGRLSFVQPLGRAPFRADGAAVEDGLLALDGVRLPIRARAAAFARRPPTPELAAAGVSGTLVYATDAGCRLRAVRLPGFEPAPAPVGEDGAACAFELSPDGSRLAESGAAWSPDGRHVAACAGSATRVTEAATGDEIYAVDGCAPSWRASNALVVAEGDRIVQWLVDCHRGRPACRRPLLEPAALRTAAARHVNAPDDGAAAVVSVVDTAWLGPDRLAVLLAAAYVYPERTLGPFETVAVFAGRRLVGAYASLGPPLGGLEAGANGRVLLALPDTLLSGDAREIRLPDAFGQVRAGALSPDGRWLALAARGAVVLVATDGSGPIPKLPVDAADVAWR